MKPTLSPFAVAALALTCSLSTLPAHAQSAYVGGSLGGTRYSDTVNGISTSGNPGGGKIFGGYQFNPNVAVELGWTQLGKSDTASGRVEGNGAYVDLVGTAPLDNNWSLLGRIGATQMRVNTNFGDDSGSTGLKLGLGAEYALSKTLALRGEWERYELKVFNEKPTADLYSIGLKLSF